MPIPAFVSVCFLAISAMIAVLGLAFAGTVHAQSGTETSATGQNQTENLLPICKQGHHMLVPLIPHLNIRGRNVVTSQKDRDPAKKIVWQRGDPPINVYDFYFDTEQPGATHIPVLDALSGQKSRFSIRGLKIGYVIPRVAIAWPGSFPTYSIDSSGLHEFIPPNLSFLGRPVLMTCRKSFPDESTDENSYTCGAYGVDPSGSGVLFDFETGIDLPGHWPATEDDWAARNWSGWVEPMAEVERIVEMMRMPKLSYERCLSP